MPRNGSGGYSLPSNSWNPAVNGTPATPSDWQTLINDVAAAMAQSLSRDGQTPLTGNLQMGGFKTTGGAVGTSVGDGLVWQQLFSQGQPANLASAATTDIGAQNTTILNITGTTTINSFGTNYNGPRFLRFAGALQLTHSATLVLPGGANITTAAGDCAIAVPFGTPASGWLVLSYSRAGASAGSFTTITASGAATLNGGVTTTTLTASGTAALNGGVTTTTLSTSGNATLGDAGTDITTINSQLSANGSVGTAGQVLASRGANLSPQWAPVVSQYSSPDTAIPAIDVEITFTHGFATIPDSYQVRLKNVTAEFGYSVGDEVEFGPMDGDGARSQGVWVNSSVIGVRIGATPFIKNRAAGGSTPITPANWRFVAYAFKFGV